MKAPHGLSVRPTSDRVKEALFNILGVLVDRSRFLDLFAGTGNVGIEALSRGAETTVFVEKKVQNIQIIRQNLSITGLAAKSRLICSSVDQALLMLGREGQKFDIIFVDPPYHKDLVPGTLEGIVKNDLLIREGMVIIESSKKDLLPQEMLFLMLARQEYYGDNVLSFYSIN
ncbi:MAG: Ribosomal RNA small subunit methyltransferase D [Pelotomaculum sp. PtaB.Bin104]|nr:MAG: Ribosomal RNA small subunit methyltransferase D [Pelotomaculum sp. PtaB.Bin104]